MTNGCVLVIEDNRDNMLLMIDVLEALNYQVVQARDGQSGVELAVTAKPDLILMDLTLPIMDGWTAVGKIKTNPASNAIPVVALSGHARAEDRERALAAGCDDYLSKPIDLSSLMVILTKLLTQEKKS
jgi:two-component system, cell cycle response regulator DivK